MYKSITIEGGGRPELSAVVNSIKITFGVTPGGSKPSEASPNFWRMKCSFEVSGMITWYYIDEPYLVSLADWRLVASAPGNTMCNIITDRSNTRIQVDIGAGVYRLGAGENRGGLFRPQVEVPIAAFSGLLRWALDTAEEAGWAFA